mgnify:CR=1 FL=1
MDAKRQSCKRQHGKKSTIRIGDSDLIRQEKRNKLTANFTGQPYTVISRKNGAITATNKHGYTVKRNVSHCKRIPRTTSESGNESDDSKDYTVPTGRTNTNSAGIENDGADEHQPPEKVREVSGKTRSTWTQNFVMNSLRFELGYT